MSTDTDSKEVTESTEFTEIVPLTRDTDGPCTTECDSGDWSAEVKQENMPAVKQEPDDVCCTANDIYRAVPGEKIKLFADDTNLFLTSCLTETVRVLSRISYQRM